MAWLVRAQDAVPDRRLRVSTVILVITVFVAILAHRAALRRMKVKCILYMYIHTLIFKLYTYFIYKLLQILSILTGLLTIHPFVVTKTTI